MAKSLFDQYPWKGSQVKLNKQFSEWTAAIMKPVPRKRRHGGQPQEHHSNSLCTSLHSSLHVCTAFLSPAYSRLVKSLSWYFPFRINYPFRFSAEQTWLHKLMTSICIWTTLGWDTVNLGTVLVSLGTKITIWSLLEQGTVGRVGVARQGGCKKADT